MELPYRLKVAARVGVIVPPLTPLNYRTTRPTALHPPFNAIKWHKIAPIRSGFSGSMPPRYGLRGTGSDIARVRVYGLQPLGF